MILRKTKKLSCPWYKNSKKKRRMKTHNKKAESKKRLSTRSCSKRLSQKFLCLMNHNRKNINRMIRRSSHSRAKAQILIQQTLTWVNTTLTLSWTWCTTMNIYSLTHPKKKRMETMKPTSILRAWLICLKIQSSRQQ